MVISFSKEVAASTVSLSSVQIFQGTTLVPYENLGVGDSSIILSPYNLQAGTTYTGVISTAVKDAKGEALSAAYRWSFTTAGKSTTTLAVTSVVPTANVAISETTVVTFSAPLNPQTVSQTSVQILQGASQVSYKIQVAGNKVMLSPVNNLAYNTTYSGVVTTAVKDTAGNTLPSQYQWSFKTAQAPVWGLDAGYPITRTATDARGNVYVAGQVGTPSDAFVGKLTNDGKVVWLKPIATPNYDGVYSVAVFGDNVCVLRLQDPTNLGFANVWVDLYSGSDGTLLWNTKTSTSDMPSKLVVDGSTIYAISDFMMAKLDDKGNILQKYSSPGSYLRDAIVTPQAIFVAGGFGSSFLRQLDLNFRLVWESACDSSFSINSIIEFPEDSVIIAAEAYQDGYQFQSFVVSYKLGADGKPRLIGKKKFSDGVHTGLKKYDIGSFYVYARDIDGAYSGAVGPVKMDLNGNVMWTASPAKSGDIIWSGGNLLVATGGNTLAVYQMP
jgi:hypothetical protein